MSVLIQSVSKNALVLGVFAVLTAGLLAYTASSTAPRIAENKRAVLERALAEVFPPQLHDNDLLADVEAVYNQHYLGYLEPKDAYIATQEGQVSGVVMQVAATEGYSGTLELLVGIDASGKLTGVRVLAHKETPGLGDAVDLKKSDWVLSFNGRSLKNPASEGWAVSKDGGAFDSFTGATITPRAVVKGVYLALQYFQQNQQSLLSFQQTASQEEVSP